MEFVFRHYGSPRYLYMKEDIKELINNNKIKNCLKLPLVKVGDFVTCCEVEDSINPTRNIGVHRTGSWKKDRVIKVTSLEIAGSYKVCGINAKLPVQASGVRFSTQEEINSFKNQI